MHLDIVHAKKHKPKNWGSQKAIMKILYKNSFVLKHHNNTIEDNTSKKIKWKAPENWPLPGFSFSEV